LANFVELIPAQTADRHSLVYRGTADSVGIKNLEFHPFASSDACVDFGRAIIFIKMDYGPNDRVSRPMRGGYHGRRGFDVPIERANEFGIMTTDENQSRCSSSPRNRKKIRNPIIGHENFWRVPRWASNVITMDRLDKIVDRGCGE